MITLEDNGGYPAEIVLEQQCERFQIRNVKIIVYLFVRGRLYKSLTDSLKLNFLNR